MTGASRGLGLAVANGLSMNGANVVGVGRSQRSSDLDPRIQYVRADLAKREDLDSLYDFVEKNYKGLNSLVNIAGISLPPTKPAEELNRFRETINADLILPFEVIAKFLNLFCDDGKSSIVNFSSINASLGFPGNPGYVAAKSGLSGLTRSLAIDLASKDIRVNSISPGYFPTSMTTRSFNDSQMHSERANRTVLKRWGEPHELVGPVAFLCSEASSYITGHDLPVDGGWIIQGL